MDVAKWLSVCTFELWVLALAKGTRSSVIKFPAARTTAVMIDGHRLVVEVASTPTARSCGLSRRKTLPEDRGMLFVYPAARDLLFWMKDTQIALSIAFLADSGRILSIQQMGDPPNAEDAENEPVEAHRT